MISGGEESKLVTPITPPQLDAPPGDEALGELASPVAEAAANSNCYQSSKTRCMSLMKLYV